MDKAKVEAAKATLAEIKKGTAEAIETLQGRAT